MRLRNVAFIPFLIHCIKAVPLIALCCRSSHSRSGSVWSSRPLWWSAQVPTGSSTAHHTLCNTCSDGPHGQRWERRSEMKLWFCLLIRLACSVNHGCHVPQWCLRTLSTLNTKTQINTCKACNYICWKKDCRCKCTFYRFFLPFILQTNLSHNTALLHSLAVTWPETGYLWLIGTKTSLKVYL